MLLEELLHVLRRTLVFEPDLEDLRLLGTRDGLRVDIDDAVRRLEGLAERHRPDAEARAVRRDPVRADEDDVGGEGRVRRQPFGHHILGPNGLRIVELLCFAGQGIAEKKDDEDE